MKENGVPILNRVGSERDVPNMSMNVWYWPTPEIGKLIRLSEFLTIVGARLRVWAGVNKTKTIS
jgi:hypothetical protein